ncbi:MAG: hypothetical protein LLG45_10935 [Actinomycetia bacterium]|nr:hypothetical protein [Actinomycetes bacterium]
MDNDTDAAAVKRREARLRRVAAGIGLAVRKSHTRDPERMDYGRYRVEDVKNDCVVAGRFPYGYTLSLDDVDEVLEELLISREEKAWENANLPGHGCSGGITSKNSFQNDAAPSGHAAGRRPRGNQQPERAR